MRHWLAGVVFFSFLSITTLGACPIPLTVQSYTPVSYQAYAPVKVVEPLVAPVAVFAPLTVQVPLYSTGYLPGCLPPVTQPPTSPAPPAAQAGETRALLQALQQINQRLDNLERLRQQENLPPLAEWSVLLEEKKSFSSSSLSPQSPPLSFSSPKIALLQQKCGECHTGAASKDGVRLFEDNGVYHPNVSEEEILASVSPPRQKMPRGKEKLNQQELDVVRNP